jgi:hypothetical protein
MAACRRARPAFRDETLERRQGLGGLWGESSDGLAVLGDLEGLAGLHAPEVNGQVLAELADSDAIGAATCFVHVAHGSTS